MNYLDALGIAGFVSAALYLIMGFPVYAKLSPSTTIYYRFLLASNISGCCFTACWAMYGYMTANLLLTATMAICFVRYLIGVIQSFLSK